MFASTLLVAMREANAADAQARSILKAYLDGKQQHKSQMIRAFNKHNGALTQRVFKLWKQMSIEEKKRNEKLMKAFASLKGREVLFFMFKNWKKAIREWRMDESRALIDEDLKYSRMVSSITCTWITARVKTNRTYTYDLDRIMKV